MNAQTSQDAITAWIAVTITGSLSAVQAEVACKDGQERQAPCIPADHLHAITLKLLKDMDKTSEIIKG